MGHFINLMPIRVQLEDKDSFVGLVLKVAQVWRLMWVLDGLERAELL